jgi:hypothetical protein
MSFLPILVHPTSGPVDVQNPRSLPLFFKSLAKTSREILAQETRSLPNDLLQGEDVRDSDGNIRNDGEIQRATVTKANPRLTAHTVQSLLWGAELGWTTLTANKTSVKAILREMKATRVAGRLDNDIANGETLDANEYGEGLSEIAAIWIVDPRSLAEGMRSDTEL